MPTPTLEEYLEVIYKLSHEGAVRPTQLAEAIGVSGPTVTNTLKRLESQGLISRAGTTVALTDRGTAASVDIVRKHRLAERFLVDVLGLDWEAAHEDACLLEHALSVRVLDALEAFMENPGVCPHGHPIPSADGTVSELAAGMLLSAAPSGRCWTVLRVAEEGEFLGELGRLGLRPGASIVVRGRSSQGDLNVEVDGEARSVAAEVASQVTVGEQDA